MKKKAMPPMAMTAGQCGRILFNFTLPEGTAMPELVGALMVHGQRVDMVREAEDRLLIPVCPPGVYLAEVRAAGVCVLYGHVEVLPSPLYEQEGVVSYTIDVDAMTDVLAVSLSMVEGIPGPRGEQGIQGERGLQGASAYDLAVAAGYEGSEAEWVSELQGAQAAANAAKESETAAAESARAAEADKTAAELARDDAQAAQEMAAAKAEKATEAAEAAQAPESLAVQAARPATMLLVKDELMSILGDASLFDLDTDGQKIIVHTDRLSDALLTAVTDMLARFVPQFIEMVQYNHNMEISWRVRAEKYAECVTREDFEKVYGARDFWNDVTSDGEWLYDTPNANAESLLSATDQEYDQIYGTKLLKATINAPRLTNAFELLKRQDKLKDAEIFIPEATSINRLCWICRNLRMAKIYAPKVQTAYLAFAACYDAPVHEIDIELPSLSNGGNFATSAKLSKNSVLKLLNSIPAYTSGTHLLTLGIHIDHQTDEEVLAAIDAAAVKGWTVEKQWNGTTTASTFALRPAPPLPVYAKLNAYTDAEGNEWPILDWCHQITSPDGKTPEELGYTLFESVAAAREYFGLPEDD